MTLNLAVLLEESAREKPEKPALIQGEDVLTHIGLRDASKKFANALVKLGIQPGDKIALMVPNVPQFAIAYYGILGVGATVVPPQRPPQSPPRLPITSKTPMQWRSSCGRA